VKDGWRAWSLNNNPVFKLHDDQTLALIQQVSGRSAGAGRIVLWDKMSEHMHDQDKTNFDRVAEAIGYIKQNFKTQPDLEEIAKSIHVSPFHFQRIFTEWAGVSPKKFLQFITVEHAKKLLRQESATLFDTAFETGLSGTGRLHDLFITIEGMSPGEYKNGGESLQINYSFAESPFGNIIVASTAKGICHLAFSDDETTAFSNLHAMFPNAQLRQIMDLAQQNVLYFFTHDWSQLNKIRLHLKGTAFQLKVWESLLKIPLGQLDSYGNIARYIGKPGSPRAVGTAIGDNPVAYLIPCHRVIQATGLFGQYHWGAVRKAAMIGWEAAQVSKRLN
jgi:AraC family transcriptional regulator of adaptative response/methylated-DNA-[protein]-cysteine methyltransferase